MGTETIAGTMGMGQTVEEHPKDWSIRKLELRPTDTPTHQRVSQHPTGDILQCRKDWRVLQTLPR